MPMYMVCVTVHDEGTFEIEADSMAEAESKVSLMDRDAIEELCEFTHGEVHIDICCQPPTTHDSHDSGKADG